MLTVIILDDEPLIAKGLSAAMDWASLGVSVAGLGFNGIEGKALIKAQRPDIVIADIVMPGLSGLDLLRYCREEGLKTRFILLSAYNHFDYARQALHQHATDYILKPIDPEKLLGAIGKAVSEIERQREMEARVTRLEQSVRRSEPIVSSALLLEAARNGPEMLTGEQLALLRDRFSARGVIACVKLFNLPVPEKKALLLWFSREMEAALHEGGLSATRGNAEETLLYWFQADSLAKARQAGEAVAAVIGNLGARLFQESGAVTVGAVSEPYESLQTLHERYAWCVNRIAEGFFHETPSVLTSAREAPSALPIFDCNRSIFQLEHGNLEEMIREHRQVQRGLRQLGDQHFAIYTFHELFRRATNIATKAGMIYKPAIEDGLASENFGAISGKSLRYFSDICAYIQAHQSILGKLVLLTEEQYTDSSFGLAAAAERLGVSAAHLSRLFKKEKGVNFTDHLIGKRIDRAKYLLRTTRLKNHEIAARVGFEDEHYFRQVFKKKCGATPRAYRQNVPRP